MTITAQVRALDFSLSFNYLPKSPFQVLQIPYLQSQRLANRRFFPVGRRMMAPSLTNKTTFGSQPSQPHHPIILLRVNVYACDFR